MEDQNAVESVEIGWIGAHCPECEEPNDATECYETIECSACGHRFCIRD